MTLWQDKQDTVPVDDSRGSKKSILPNSTLAAVVGLFAGVGGSAGRACQSVAKVEVLTTIRAALTKHRDFILVSFRFGQTKQKH